MGLKTLQVGLYKQFHTKQTQYRYKTTY